MKIRFCNHENFVNIFKIFRPDIYEKKYINNRKKYLRTWNFCKNCKLHFSKSSHSINEAELYKKFYRSNKSAYRLRNQEENFLKIIKLKKSESETLNRIDRIKKFFKEKKFSLKKNSKVLDVGGASGVFAYLLKKQMKLKNINVIDLSDQGEFLRKYKINYIQKDILKFKNNVKFDLITCNFVLEHLDNPLRLIKKMLSLLKKHGLLYIEVPSGISFKKYNKNHDTFNSTHKFIFTKLSFNELSFRSNFKIINFNQGKNKRGYYYLGVYVAK